MKIPSFWRHAIILFFLGGTLLNVAANTNYHAPYPEWPSIDKLYHQGFDQPCYQQDNQPIGPTVYAESWSGWCLDRTSIVVTPWVIPIIRADGSWNVDPQQGAIRFWLQPKFSRGNGPGHVATLLTLVATNGTSQATFWSLVVSPDGKSVELVCQQDTGPAVCLNAPVSLRSGTWALVTFGYSQTNCALNIDGRDVGVGEGMTTVPASAASYTALVIGSDLAGQSTAFAQFDELDTFTGRGRSQPVHPSTFGVLDTEISQYYSAMNQAVSGIAASQGSTPMSPDAIRWSPTEIVKPQRLTGSSVTLAVPVVSGTNLLLTVLNGATNQSYNIDFTPILELYPWTTISTGRMGQFSFTVPLSGFTGFMKAEVGNDWDGDGIPNWEDANPSDPTVGILYITIDSPTNGSSLY